MILEDHFPVFEAKETIIIDQMGVYGKYNKYLI